MSLRRSLPPFSLLIKAIRIKRSGVSLTADPNLSFDDWPLMPSCQGLKAKRKTGLWPLNVTGLQGVNRGVKTRAETPIPIHHVQPCHHQQNHSVLVLMRSCFCSNQLFSVWICFSNWENWNYEMTHKPSLRNVNNEAQQIDLKMHYLCLRNVLTDQI